VAIQQPASDDTSRDRTTAAEAAQAPQRGTQPDATEPVTEPRPRRSASSIFKVLLPAVIVIDVLAFVFVPPFVKDEPTKPVGGIKDLIDANIEFPAPEVVLPPGAHSPNSMIFFEPTISNTILTSWIVIAIVLVLVFIATRGLAAVPRPIQNVVEFIYEALENFALSLGGETARPYVPVFAGFFLFILFSNWFGLLPITGKLEFLRAPTSDVNVTIGLALTSFLFFEYQGFRRLGVRGYLGKFFPLGAFRDGVGAGVLAMFVGFIEFFLEFIKPVTLSMRLFGNIFGGEIALGVLTALTIAILPVGMLGLELLLNFVQALIFSTLTLMFTLIAIEGHGEEEHVAPEPPELPEGNLGPPLATSEPQRAH
jgi:F-type H+-transporting ATPase subunit a